jgi:hypothetical protein
MLKIIIGLVVAWLLGSTIYSIQFHLRNYFNSRKGDTLIAKDLEAPGQEILMKKSEFLRRVLGIQIIKLLIAIFLIYFLIK